MQPAGVGQALSGFYTSKHNTACTEHISPLIYEVAIVLPAGSTLPVLLFQQYTRLSNALVV